MTHSFDRRSFLAGGVALGAGLAALGSEPDWAGAVLTNGPGRNGVSKAKPKRGGSIVFGMDTEEGGFDPTSARWDEGGFLYGRCVFDPLAIVTAAGKVEPYLAQSITSNPDFTVFTITLRKGIVFHDGTPLDAAALLLNLQKQAASILTGPAFQNIASSAITGPLTVAVTMKTPWQPFPYYLAQAQTGYIAAPSMLNNKNGTTHPIGTGPFVFQEWVPNSHFTATANPHYWRPGLPYLSSITFKPILSSASRVSALESGTIDIMHTNTPRTFGSFRHNTKWAYVDNSGAVLGQPDVNCVMLNTGAAPFNNKTLRTALAKASNSKQYAKVIDLGVNQPMSGLFLPGSPYYTKTAYPSFDPKGAAKLVKQIETQTGSPVSFTLTATNDPDVERAAQFLQQEWQTAGMKVSINIQEQSALINDALAGTYQATTWRQFGAVNPDLNYVWWSDTTTKAPLPLNMARNSDPRLQAALVTGRTTSDPAARVKAYQQINQYLGEDIPYIYGDRSTWAVAANPKVQNFANPTTPSGSKAIGFDAGVIWPAQIWVT
ncbi:MAG TPA: ABC transporter substrate-binding protein [Acidimicrobiales bacterium]|nr:ABC transporter substrate-binding protein [Acidimicrobiales bacterium]